jgi:hypothetical protein
MPRNSALAVRRCTERWQDTASVPIKIRPHVDAALAADLADETMLDVGQANVVGPCIRSDGCYMGCLGYDRGRFFGLAA